MSKKVQTIEKTGKFWKLLSLAGVVLTIIGTVWIFRASGDVPADDTLINPYSTLLFGLLVLIISKAGGWWFHG